MAATRKFRFKEGSKFLEKSEPQEAMMDAIRSTVGNGILVAPCGCGKSAVIIEALMAAGTLGLVLCYESQGVFQMAEAIRSNTSIFDFQLYVFSGKSKKVPQRNAPYCYFITTYGMFSKATSSSGEASKEARKFVFETPWDLVCLDEFHHANAKTYEPMIRQLATTSKRMLGFTATLYRSELRAFGPHNSLEHEERAFGWFGPVLFRRRTKDLEDVGLIAKIKRATVRTPFTREFAIAYREAVGVQNIYLAALNPNKLNALVAICAQHTAAGHKGIVFANHLVVAKIVCECLGEGWRVLSGGVAHGVEEKPRSPEDNAEIVKEFNAGKLKGMVCTTVGESSMDVHYERFCFVCVMDADAGLAAAAQRLGRVARSDRINRVGCESDEELTARRLKEQKKAWYYDFITEDSSDCAAAATRDQLFAVEGYGSAQEVSPVRVLATAAKAGVALPYVGRLDKEMRLLKDILGYNKLGEVCAHANVAAAASQHPQRAIVKANQQALNAATNCVSKALASRKLKQAQQQLSHTIAKSKQTRRLAIDNSGMSAETRRIFQKLRLGADVLGRAGLLASVAMAPSDDDEDEDEEENDNGKGGV